MADPQIPPRADVNLQINEDDEIPRISTNGNVIDRFRNYSAIRINNLVTPIVDNVNTYISTLAWLHRNNNNNNNVNENNPVSPNNLSVTITNQSENSLAVSVDINRDDIPAENANETNQESPGTPTSNENETRGNNLPRTDPDNAQNNRTVYMNINEYLPSIFKCISFLLVLLTKFMYDHLEGVVTFVFMQGIFLFICDEQSNLQIKSPLRMIVKFAVIAKALEYILTYEGLQIIPVYKSNFIAPEDIWQLLWIVFMNDCMLQLITMGLKLIFNCFPLKIISFKTKLKVYSFIENMSQLYRTVVPTQPWFTYFLNSYQGLDYILGVSLATVYILLKLPDYSMKTVAGGDAMRNLLRRSGSVPLNKEQLILQGIKCSICLDDFDFPIQLNCQHIFCSTCIQQWSVKKQSCPLCRTPMSEDFASANITSNVYFQIF